MIELIDGLNRNRRRSINIVVFMVVFLLIISGPLHAAASGWDAAFSNIEQLHDRFTALESAITTDKQQITALRKQNNDRLQEINRKVQLIDKVLVERLKSEAEQAKRKYAPMLAEYAELGRKAAEARKRKDSKSALLFDLKRNRIKASALAAKQEIKAKKEALAAAKKQANAKAKAVKAELLPVQAFKKQITVENAKIAELNKSKQEANKRYKTAVKQGDAVSAAAELKGMVEALNRVQVSQRKILEWEGNIAKALRSAEAKIPV
ncbi:hypothetical protein [Paenibacillus azoreducens]|uniref:hypothetical protein n=1 Tax=Paenibacillus azoreducens TaxID=116718 RepID=UPI001BB3D9F8|nr:hypothetical protein [Paenibacillus azoreducens]